MKLIAYIKSYFTNTPQLISHTAEWYFVKGKRKSAYQLMSEKLEKDEQRIRSRIINGPNIDLNK